MEVDPKYRIETSKVLSFVHWLEWDGGDAARLYKAMLATAPEPEKAQGVDSVDTLSGREPPADLSLDELKRECGEKLSALIPHSYSDNTMLNTIDYLASQGRISGISKEGEE